jgi:hypothetical protein
MGRDVSFKIYILYFIIAGDIPAVSILPKFGVIFYETIF